MNNFGGTMRQLITVMALALATCAAGVTYAADDAASAPAKSSKRVKTLTPQQQKMSDCNAQAEGKARDDRVAFMKECLSGAAVAADGAGSGTKTKPQRVKTLTAQQQKMSDCNGAAEGKPREERQAFMKQCLSGDAVADAASGPKVKAQRLRAMSPEQQKKSDCGAKAQGKPRDERVAFVKECMAN